MDVMRVLAIHTFPVHGEAGVDHASVQVGVAGLAGDRHKKAAVSLVGADAPQTRAKLLLDAAVGEPGSIHVGDRVETA